MFNSMHPLTAFKRFTQKQDGSVTIEFLLMVPLLIWAILATLTFFYSFRADYLATKSTTSLADIVSRETNYITPAYMDSLQDSFNFLVQSNESTSLRLSVFTGNKSGGYDLSWSKQRGGSGPALSSASLSAMSNRLPTLDAGQSAILLETWSKYNPLSLGDIGFSQFEFKKFVVTYPMFTPQTCFAATPVTPRIDATC